MLTTAVFVAAVVVSVLSAAHALLTKRDPRSAVGWIAVCVGIPGLGAVLYWLIGVNRIRTRARKYQSHWRRLLPRRAGGTSEVLVGHMPEHLIPAAYAPLVHLAGAVTRRPLLPGNDLRVLYGGEEAYPAMLEAISRARQCVFLSSYIFAADSTGERFVSELAEAVRRGVDVRVLLDGFGQFYSWPRSRRLLRRADVPHAEFLPFSLWRSRLHLNLRNHRKLLVVDRLVGFTGGMNIWDRHLAADPSRRHRVADVHFRVEGPVVLQMEESFREDWAFATGHPFRPEDYAFVYDERPAVCRGVNAGPNEDFEKLQWIVLGALHAARKRVRIMTPYFVPAREIVAALNAAALRGVEVDVVLPAENNYPLVEWACRSLQPDMLEQGVRFWYQPPPFAHTKMLLVDEVYALIGSANLDTRSFRLNFEFNLEIFDDRVVAELAGFVDRTRAGSEEVTSEAAAGRGLGVRLRDATAGLLAPYL